MSNNTTLEVTLSHFCSLHRSAYSVREGDIKYQDTKILETYVGCWLQCCSSRGCKGHGETLISWNSAMAEVSILAYNVFYLPLFLLLQLMPRIWHGFMTMRFFYYSNSIHVDVGSIQQMWMYYEKYITQCIMYS